MTIKAIIAPYEQGSDVHLQQQMARDQLLTMSDQRNPEGGETAPEHTRAYRMVQMQDAEGISEQTQSVGIAHSRNLGGSVPRVEEDEDDEEEDASNHAVPRLSRVLAPPPPPRVLISLERIVEGRVLDGNTPPMVHKLVAYLATQGYEVAHFCSSVMFGIVSDTTARKWFNTTHLWQNCVLIGAANMIEWYDAQMEGRAARPASYLAEGPIFDAIIAVRNMRKPKTSCRKHLVCACKKCKDDKYCKIW